MGKVSQKTIDYLSSMGKAFARVGSNSIANIYHRQANLYKKRNAKARLDRLIKEGHELIKNYEFAGATSRYIIAADHAETHDLPIPDADLERMRYVLPLENNFSESDAEALTKLSRVINQSFPFPDVDIKKSAREASEAWKR